MKGAVLMVLKAMSCVKFGLLSIRCICGENEKVATSGRSKGGILPPMSLTQLYMAKKNVQRAMRMRGGDREGYASDLVKIENAIMMVSIAKFNQAQKEIVEGRRLQSRSQAKRRNYEVLEVARNLRYFY
jgi:hypothetical protein